MFLFIHLLLLLIEALLLSRNIRVVVCKEVVFEGVYVMTVTPQDLVGLVYDCLVGMSFEF